MSRMGKLVVFEWMSLDGVFDAETMGEWWEPYDSDDRQRCIQDTYLHTDAFLMGRQTYEMLGPHWSSLGDDEAGASLASSTTPRSTWSAAGSPILPGRTPP